MSMLFQSYRYLWPPRPEKAIPRDLLRLYERQGFTAQVKMNGTCNVLAISPEKKIVAMTRHNEPHKLWSPTAASSVAFKNLSGKGWYVFVTELLHSKVPGIKDINYVNDILVDDGCYLVGMSFAERQGLIRALLPQKGRETISHFEANSNTWVAKNHDAEFTKLFSALDRPEHEGLVLKNPKAPLALCGRATGNTAWQLKCRKPHKNYGF
jgi:hypothetical protein